MNPYQKLIMFLGFSIFIGIGYFVYKSFDTNVKNSTNGNSSLISQNLAKINSNSLIIDKILGNYTATKENSTIVKTLELKKDGNVIFTNKDISLNDSDNTTEYGTWFVDSIGKVQIYFPSLSQKLIFENKETDTLNLVEESDFYDKREDFVFIKNKE